MEYMAVELKKIIKLHMYLVDPNEKWWIDDTWRWRYREIMDINVIYDFHNSFELNVKK